MSPSRTMHHTSPAYNDLKDKHETLNQLSDLTFYMKWVCFTVVVVAIAFVNILAALLTLSLILSLDYLFGDIKPAKPTYKNQNYTREYKSQSFFTTSSPRDNQYRFTKPPRTH